MSTTDTANAREQALDAAARLVADRARPDGGKPLLQLAHELITATAGDSIDTAGLDLSDVVEVCARAAVLVTGIPDRHEAAQAWADRWYAAHPSTAAENIAAHACNAVTNQVGGLFVPLSVRQQIAAAVLAAVEPLIRADERNARAIPGGTPRVRVEIQDPHGAWWMPEPGPALTAALTAAADEATLRTIGADFRPRLRAAAAGLIKALDRYGRAGG